MRTSICFLAVSSLFVWLVSGCQSEPIDYSGPTGDWVDYGGTTFGQRFSPLNQITPGNVDQLEVAWTYHTGDVSDGRGDIPSGTAFEATPILVDSTLYLPTPFNRVIALNPETGEERWVYDPKIDLTGHYANQLLCRGVSYWQDTLSGSPCTKRIFTATNDARLIAIDAATGLPCEDFGIRGEVDLNAGVGKQRWKGEYQVTSSPAIAGDLVIVGSAVSDNDRVKAPSGVVRAFDARSGDIRWSWDLAPPDSVVPAEMLSEEGYLLGSPNVWGPMAVDESLGLVYVPTGNPSPDYYGGLRNGSDYYGSSIVALKTETGEVAWHFQTVHHDLWDFDVPAQPTLVDIEQNGQLVTAVIQATKMGFLFVLNRKTGEPIFPIEERPVPQSTVPGEITSPTQPFPVKPPPLVPNDMSPEDGWGPFGFDGACDELLAKMHFEGMYTPPKVGQPTLMYPGNAGGSNWGGIAVDPANQIAVANVMNLAWSVELIPAAELETARKANPGLEIGPQTGTPYAMKRALLISPLGLPCNPPPWGTIAAVDLKEGDILWQHPLGTVRDVAPIPLNLKYGVPNLGGPLITGSGLIFIGATVDNYLRALDLKTGKEIWKARLPAGGQATPMTYRLRKTGKQYIVIAAGGHSRAGTKLGDAVIAYSLE